MLKNTFALVLFMSLTMFAEGFVADTVVYTPGGYVAIQDLSIGDEVFAYDCSDGLIREQITSVSQGTTGHLVRLIIDGAIINVDHDHKFYVPLEHCWLTASNLAIGQHILCGLSKTEPIRAIDKHSQVATVYNISLANHHNYLVSPRAIVVHNFLALSTFTLAPIATAESITLLNAFLMANPLVAPITIGVGGAGLASYLIWNFISEIKQSKGASKKDKGQNNNNRPCQNPNGDDNSVDHRAAAVALLKAIDESKEKAAEVFYKSYEWLLSDTGLKSVVHCFKDKPHHNFGPLLSRMGGNTEDVWFKIVAEVTRKLTTMGTKFAINTAGVFKDVVVEYKGELITVQGIVMDKMIKISTMFIQDIHVR